MHLSRTAIVSSLQARRNALLEQNYTTSDPAIVAANLRIIGTIDADIDRVRYGK